MSASLAAPASSQHSEHNGASSQRAMRLKVLYTFDAEGKQTCLTRWHQFIYTQVYYLNPNTPIGVVDIKTCLNSIASASPEIVAYLDRDYSVYSFDYSEEDVPLQGLGMLSWIMGSSSANGNGSQQSQSSSRLVTGRVVSAQMSLFKSEKDTLEVKLKLVPVPTIKQSDYINSMNVYNTLSKIIPGDFDPSAWSAYFQANPGLLQAAEAVNAGAGSVQGPGPNGANREATVQAHPPPPPPAPPQQQQSQQSQQSQPMHAQQVPPVQHSHSIQHQHQHQHQHQVQHHQHQQVSVPPPPPPPQSQQIHVPPPPPQITQAPPQHYQQPPQYSQHHQPQHMQQPHQQPQHPCPIPPHQHQHQQQHTLHHHMHHPHQHQQLQQHHQAPHAISQHQNQLPPQPQPQSNPNPHQQTPVQYQSQPQAPQQLIQVPPPVQAHPQPQSQAQPQPPIQQAQPVGPTNTNSSQPTAEESGAPKKKPRKRNPRPPAGSNGGKKKVIPTSVPSAVSTPAELGPEPCMLIPIPPSDSTFASPDLPRAVPVRQPYSNSPLADIPTAESFTTPQLESPAIPGSSPPTEDLTQTDESPQLDYSPEPTSPTFPASQNEQNDHNEHIEHEQNYATHDMDISKELDSLFNSNHQMNMEQMDETMHDQEPEPEQQNSPEVVVKVDSHAPDASAPQAFPNDIPPLPPSPSPALPTAESSVETTVEQETGAAPSASPLAGIQFPAPLDEVFTPAAPSPMVDFPATANISEKPPKKKRKYARKKGPLPDGTTPSDGIFEDDEKKGKGSMKPTDENSQGTDTNKSRKSKSGAKVDGERRSGDDSEKPRSQGPTSAKERIEAQLRQAVEEGKMPNYCENCGAIETPTWRRVVFKDENGDTEKDRNILLCNPCGLWHATKKSMRPAEFWDPKKESGPPKRPRNNRKRKATGAPQNDIPQEFERNTQTHVQMAAMSEPIVIDDGDEVLAPTAKGAKTPIAGNTRGSSEWEKVVAASQRKIQSSPVKKEGTSESPIELDKSPCPRRLLFPRCVGKATLDMNEDARLDSAVFDRDMVHKENIAPSSASRNKLQSPMTPRRRRLAGPPNATPERRTPSRAAALRSPYRPLKTPQKKSPEKNAAATGTSVSPNTADLLNRLLSESNGDNSTHPFLPNISGSFDSFFNLESDDVFSTEDMMPSSPPPLFNLYEDAAEEGEQGSSAWSDLLPDDSEDFNGILGNIDGNVLQGYGNSKHGNGHAAGEPMVLGGSSSAGGDGGALTVDFSTFFDNTVVEDEAGKIRIVE